MKKLSELMLEGYSMVGAQCEGQEYEGDSPFNPAAVCAIGAAQLALTGRASGYGGADFFAQLDRFEDSVGFTVADLNDRGMSIPDIAGIAAAEGL